jgi:pimeloyl-ACP methyl ester carboxylesterase
MSAKQPLLLLHGVSGSANMWSRVVPLLQAQYEVLAPTALGHRGGSAATLRPVRFEHVVDDLVRMLDARGLERVHAAGNSMGGWAALELARRGRALSVCALSPAGMWEINGRDQRHAQRTLRTVAQQARSSRKLLPWLVRFSLFRHVALRPTAAHGERVTGAEFLELSDDMIGCAALDDLLATEEAFAPMLELTCPVTLAWSELDRILPLRTLGQRARTLMPAARFLVLPGVGHVPMLDDAQLVADTILAATRAV